MCAGIVIFVFDLQSALVDVLGYASMLIAESDTYDHNVVSAVIFPLNPYIHIMFFGTYPVLKQKNLMEYLTTYAHKSKSRRQCLVLLL